MSVEQIVSANQEQQAYTCLSSDNKPGKDQGVIDFALLLERDTGIVYRFIGERWFIEKSAGAFSNIIYNDVQILTGRAFSVAKHVQNIAGNGTSETLFVTSDQVITQGNIISVDIADGSALLEFYECSAGNPGTLLQPRNLNLSSSIASVTSVSNAPTGVVVSGDPLDGGIIIGGEEGELGGSKYGNIGFVVSFEVKRLLMRLTNLTSTAIGNAFIRYRWYEDTRQGVARNYDPPLL